MGNPLNLKARLARAANFLILTAVVIFHAIANYLYLAYDNLPPVWDPSVHLGLSLQYYWVLSLPPSINLPSQLAALSGYYPPFVYIATAPLYGLLGTSADAATLVNSAFLGIAVFTTYGIGRELLTRRAAMAGAVLLSFYPVVFGLSREYFLDVGLMGMVSLANYWAIRTRVRTLGHSSVYAFLFGLAFLTKWTAPLFTVPLLLVMLFRPSILPVTTPSKELEKGEPKGVMGYLRQGWAGSLLRLGTILLLSILTVESVYRPNPSDLIGNLVRYSLTDKSIPPVP